MDAADLFVHLHSFSIGQLTADELWDYLSDHDVEAEECLDEDALDAFDTAMLVLAEYTGGYIDEEVARQRLRSLIPQFLSQYRVFVIRQGLQPWKPVADELNLIARFSAMVHQDLEWTVQASQTAHVDTTERSPGSDMRAQSRTGRVWEFAELQAVRQSRTRVVGPGFA